MNRRRIDSSILILLAIAAGSGRGASADAPPHPLARAALEAARSAKPTEALPKLATRLASQGDDAVKLIRSLVTDDDPAAPAVAAELLWLAAQKDQLNDDLATVAGELLGHEDRFVGALAEWAIATKVQRENGGQEIRWPRDNAPLGHPR